MNDIVAEIFGYGVLLVAIALFLWEIHVYRRGDDEVTWLVTPARLRRRMIVAFLLLMVGILILLESYGFLVLNNVRDLAIYVFSLTAIAFLLIILSVRDLGDMARNAERHAVKELEIALEEQNRKDGSSAPGSSE